MSTGEALYLALVILAMVSFMATLSFVTYGGKATPRRPAREPGVKHVAAGAH